MISFKDAIKYKTKDTEYVFATSYSTKNRMYDNPNAKIICVTGKKVIKQVLFSTPWETQKNCDDTCIWKKRGLPKVEAVEYNGITGDIVRIF
jgi:hypothetical protein